MQIVAPFGAYDVKARPIAREGRVRCNGG